MKLFHRLAPLFLAFFTVISAQAQTSLDHAVQAHAAPVSNGIRITWPAYTPGAVDRVMIARKKPQDALWTPVTEVFPPDTSFVDTSVSPGEVWEYRVQRQLVNNPPSGSIAGNGFLLSADGRAAQHQRGKILLLVDSTLANPLAAKIERLRWDLRGDGWQTLRMDAAPTDSAWAVRSQIQTLANQHPELEGIFILGHVPVPHAGNVAPDGHTNTHMGAWAADVFYGELNGTWTDNSVNETSANRPENHNVPGDGKPDQGRLNNFGGSAGSDLDLFVGRADFAGMPAFAESDTALLANYLDKDHRWRTRQYTAPMRGLVEDNFGHFNGEAFAASGYRNFSSLVGPDSVNTLDFTNTLEDNPYLWAYGTGAGSITSVGGVVNTSTLSQDTMNAVFSLLFGSFHGDWDAQNNVMRAMIAQGDVTLTCGWAGRPHWWLHHMGLGETIGHSFRKTVNNPPFNNAIYQPQNFGSNGIWLNILGDPALRMQYPAPAQNLQASVNQPSPSDAPTVNLTWQAANGPVAGYHVYRALGPDEPFQRLTNQPLMATSFSDNSPTADTLAYYMVRSVKLDTTASGTYWNLGTGRWDTAAVPAVNCPAAAISGPTSLCGGETPAFSHPQSADWMLLSDAGLSLQGPDSNVNSVQLQVPGGAVSIDTLIARHTSGFCADTLALTVSDISLTAQTTPDSNGQGVGTAVVSPATGTPPFTYNWNNGATDSLNTGLTPGDYVVTVTDANGCSITDTLNVGGVTGRREAARAIGLRLFPNPAQGSVTLKRQSGGSMQVELHGLDGRHLRSWQLAPSEHRLRISRGELPSGAYLLRWQTSEHTGTLRLVWQ